MLVDELIEPQRLDRALWKAATCIPRHPDKSLESAFYSFARDWPNHRRALQEEIRHGNYKLRGYTGFRRPKPNGIRTISVPHFMDRIVQVALHDVLSNKVHRIVCTPSCFGAKSYPGQEPSDIMQASNRISRRRNEKKWFFETDIQSFFPNVSKDMLLRKLIDLEIEPTIVSLVSLFATTDVINRAELKNKLDKQWQDAYWDPVSGIPQGSVLSPLLANLYLSSFDKSMRELGFEVFRYVDDLIVCCETEEEALKAEHTTHELLLGLNLKMHRLGDDEKTKIVRPTESLTFLGITFAPDGTRLPKKKSIDKLDEKIKSLSTGKERRPTLPELTTKFNGVITGWIEAYRFCHLKDERLKQIDKTHAKHIANWFRDAHLSNIAECIGDPEYRYRLGFTSLVLAKRTPIRNAQRRTRILDTFHAITPSPSDSVLDQLSATAHRR